MPSMENKKLQVEKKKNTQKGKPAFKQRNLSIFNKLISNNGLPLYIYRWVLRVKYLCLPQICFIYRMGGVSPTGQCNESQHNPRKVNQSDLIIFHHGKKKLEIGNLKSFRMQKKKSFHCNSFLSMLAFPGVNTAMQWTLGGRRVQAIIPGSCRTVWEYLSWYVLLQSKAL